MFSCDLASVSQLWVDKPKKKPMSIQYGFLKINPLFSYLIRLELMERHISRLELCTNTMYPQFTFPFYCSLVPTHEVLSCEVIELSSNQIVYELYHKTVNSFPSKNLEDSDWDFNPWMPKHITKDQFIVRSILKALFLIIFKCNYLLYMFSIKIHIFITSCIF